MLVVFTGPSLDAATVRVALPYADVRPPACRGDIDAAVTQGATGILLIDGGFAHRLAVAPSEIVRALRTGVPMVGAASLGAIRAAECHHAGMMGLGAIQRLYRLRVLSEDDEVAVATEPDRDFRASSVALVNVRFAMLAALRAGLLRRPSAEAVLAAAKRRPFSERLWNAILHEAGAHDEPELTALCHATDVKRRDAELAVARVAAHPPRPAVPGTTPARPVRPAVRESYLGLPAEVACPQLGRWLIDSGRYRRYWREPPRTAERAWTDLVQRGQLDYELMRWYAAVRLGAIAAPDRRLAL